MTALLENRAAVLHGPGDIRVEPRPVPVAGAGQVLVRVLACGICGSDVHYFREGRIGHYVVAAPLVLGHEAAGEIVGIGDGVDPARMGSIVALEPGIPCRRCEQCLGGRYNQCPDVRFFATPPVDGALTDYVAVDAAWAHPAPPGMTAEIAAMAEPVSVGVWACRRAQVTVGDRVLVMGAGPIGLFAAQVARACGAQVEVFDVRPARLALAGALGFATSAMSPGRDAYSVLLECSGNQEAIDGALAVLAPGARVVLIGMGASRVSFDLGTVQALELQILGSFRYASTYPVALDLLASGAVRAEPLITHRFGLDDVGVALSAESSLPDAVKVVVGLTPAR